MASLPKENTPHSPRQMLDMLKWYRAAGVDIGMCETPGNQYKEPAKAAQAVKKAGFQPQKPGSPAAHSVALGKDSPASSPPEPDGSLNAPDEAKKLASEAQNLDELKNRLESYQGCGLRLRATQLVFGDGNPHAEIMLIGEAPGRDEDLQGIPFVGRSGQLLDRMLGAIGLDREAVYIANTVPWRPPGNRTPSPLEISVCLPFLVRQVELVAPKIIITLGAAATQTIFNEKLSILRTRGKWREISLGAHTARTMPTLHPAFLLRQPAQKRQVWQDMLGIRRALDELG